VNLGFMNAYALEGIVAPRIADLTGNT